jgi:hypothetical protein
MRAQLSKAEMRLRDGLASALRGTPKGSRALTLLAPTGERLAFYEAARQYDKKALQVMASPAPCESRMRGRRSAAQPQAGAAHHRLASVAQRPFIRINGRKFPCSLPSPPINHFFPPANRLPTGRASWETRATFRSAGAPDQIHPTVGCRASAGGRRRRINVP